MEKVKQDELMKSYVDDPGLFVEWSANDRRLVAYPCSENKVFNLCAFMPSAEAKVDTQEDSE